MEFLVVIADHDGAWHCVGGGSWDQAVAQFSSVIGVLTAIDYYEDTPPTVAKIIRGRETDYANAHAVASAAEDEG